MSLLLRGNRHYALPFFENQQQQEKKCDDNDALFIWEDTLSNTLSQSSPCRPPLTDRNDKAAATTEFLRKMAGLPEESCDSDNLRPKTTKSFETTAELFAWNMGQFKGHNKNKEFLDIVHAKVLRLFLDDYVHSQYWHLLESLHSNQTMDKVKVFRNRQTDGARIRTQEELECFFFALADQHVQPLGELHLWNFRSEDLPVLTKGLSILKRLEYIQLHMESGTIDETMANSLASLQSLISLELEVNKSFPVAAILESKSLLVLGIVGKSFEFQNEQMVAIALKLGSNQVLTVLDIEPKIPTYSLIILMLALPHNKTLETLQFSCECDLLLTEEGDSTVLEVLNTLSVNSRLRVIWNHSSESLVVSDEVKKQTLCILQENQTIEQFHIFCEDPSFMLQKHAILDRNIENNK